MFSAAKLSRFTIATLLALTVAVLSAAPALADGETPPPPDEGTTTVATEEAAPTEAATEIAAVTETSVEEPASEATDTTAETLALPEGTELVVVNADGESVPLASEEATEIIAGGDPIWCPVGVAPKPGVPPCSTTQTSLADLLALYPFGFPSNGVIWIEDGTAVDAGVTIDGSGGWSLAAGFSITIQGGWNGVSGSTALDPVDPYTYFDGFQTDYLKIINWVGAITIKNVVFNATPDSIPNNNAVLYVQTKGNIVLDKVQANDADNTNGSYTASGAWLDNSGGTGNVTVSNSSFNNNEGDGLYIDSAGTVTLKNLYAFSNGGAGVDVDNRDATTAKSVTLTNATFSGNTESGLFVLSEGAITVSNISADLNGVYGAHLRNDYASFAAAVYVNGVNSFNGNMGGVTTAGLYVQSKGLIKVSSTTANGNTGSGVWLTNWLSPFVSSVTISGFLNANDNDSVGLEIYSSGPITAANITANNNTFAGSLIDNSINTTARNVLITGTNTFNNNGNEGLTVHSDGSITLYSFTANNNGFDGDHEGVVLKNDYDSLKQMSVTLNGYNTFMGNASTGLVIDSYGVITLNYVTAVNNGKGTLLDSSGSGAILNNLDGFYAKAVSIKGINLFSDNDWTGLEIYSDGAISVAKTTANTNGATGVILDNYDSGSPVSSGVTISGYLVANDNPGKGLWLDSTGAVLATNITTNGNDEEGTQIINDYWSTPKGVTLSGINTFNDNFYEGLVIQSSGAVLLNNVTANYNGNSGSYFGLLINNDWLMPNQLAVTLIGTNVFMWNEGGGVNIDSFGPITLNNVSALYNGLGVVNGNGSGAYLENLTGGLYARPVSLKGVNVFNGNDGFGLQILSFGVVSVSKVTANDNNWAGVDVDNDGSTAQSNVIISGYGVINNNGTSLGGYGLKIYSHGAITLANITAQYNYGFGADLYTIGVTTAHAVTLTGTNSFNYNGDGLGGGLAIYESGLNVNADGNITVYNITASYNYFSGALLDNDTNWAFPVTPFINFGSVFVYGFGNFVGNETGFGLLAWSHGSITINRVTANDNGDLGDYLTYDDAGIQLRAGLDGGIGTVTIVCSSAYGNAQDGVYISATGLITLKGLLSYANGTNEDFTGTLAPRAVCP